MKTLLQFDGGKIRSPILLLQFMFEIIRIILIPKIRKNSNQCTTL